MRLCPPLSSLRSFAPENHQPNQSARNSARTALPIGAVSKFHGAAAGLEDGLVSVVEWSSVLGGHI